MIVGVLGGGQLARMLALAGLPLGARTVVLDPAADACARAAAEHLHAGYEDAAALAQLARADVATYEFENVPLESARRLADRVPLHPSLSALAAAQDRLEEKRLFQRLGIATPAFAPVDSIADLERAMADIGLPALLKTRRLGYDGKGQALLRRREDAPAAWERLNRAPALLEAFVPFTREASIIAVRGRSGETLFYPLSENVHRDGILRLARSRPDDPMQASAQDYAERLLSALNYVGVLALELFEVDGRLLANEFAPRVHNSGHWTIEGAETSQFENHLRAILGLPLGATGPVGRAAMVNFIGAMPEAAAVLRLPQVHLHDYEKRAQPGRKVGHATVRAPDDESVKRLTSPLLALAGVGDIALER